MADDRGDIINLINLYAVAVDSQRWDLFDKIFTADADVDFGGASRWSDIESFKRDFAAYHDPFDGTQHAMSGHVVALSGDTAHGICYGNWRLIRRGLEGGDLWEGTGWYDDTLVRTAQGWRIRRRVCRVMYWRGNPHVNEPIPGIKFEAGFESLRVHGDAGSVDFLRAIGA